MASRSVRIRPGVVEALVGHARSDAPLECCGLLVGTPLAIEACVPTPNIRQSASAYQVDPATHFAVLRRVRSEGRRIVGAYHSHTRAPAVPSERDVAEAHDSELLYVIVSVKDPAAPVVRGYAIADGTWSEIELITE